MSDVVDKRLTDMSSFFLFFECPLSSKIKEGDSKIRGELLSKHRIDGISPFRT